jgi:hypothetical protein
LFDVITGTSEGGTRRRDMPDFVLGGSTLFVGVYGEVKRADTSLAKLAVSTEQNDQIGRYLSQTGVVLLCNVRGTWIPGRHPRRHRHHRRGEAFHDEPIDLYNGALDLRAASSRVVCVRFARDSSLEGGGFEPSVSVATSEGEVERAQARKTLSLTGTEGSNPPPSSGESVSRGTLSSWAKTPAFRAGFQAAFPARSVERRRARQQRANPQQYLCRAIFQYPVFRRCGRDKSLG